MVRLINLEYVESDRKTCESDSSDQAYYEELGYEEVNRRNGLSIMGTQAQMLATLEINGAEYQADIRHLVMSYFGLQRASRNSARKFRNLVNCGRVCLEVSGNGELYYVVR